MRGTDVIVLAVVAGRPLRQPRLSLAGQVQVRGLRQGTGLGILA